MISSRKFFQNVTGQMFLDFAVARHGLRYFCGGILIPIMPAAVPDKNATEFSNFFDEVTMFHASSSSA
jgi:hypothetical protein